LYPHRIRVIGALSPKTSNYENPLAFREYPIASILSGCADSALSDSVHPFGMHGIREGWRALELFSRRTGRIRTEAAT
jgi:hypothetical protein